VNLKKKTHLGGFVVDGRIILNGCEKKSRMGGHGLDLYGSAWGHLAFLENTVMNFRIPLNTGNFLIA
jgi:hypothetical protein